MLVFQRLAIKGSWDDSPIPSGRVGVVLAPAPKTVPLINGNPYSPHTRAFLDYLDGGPVHGTVVDAGTGNGILGLAAARLGATVVHAYEGNPYAVDQARANVALNGLDGSITVTLGDLQSIVLPACDLLLCDVDSAEVLGSVLSGASLNPGGHLLCLPQKVDVVATETQATVSGLLLVEHKPVGPLWTLSHFRSTQ